MPDHRALGRLAEDLAAEYLLAQGYTLVTRRCKMRHGELDIVALDGEELVFVEVKARNAPEYKPEESVGNQKRKALEAAAGQYIVEMEQEHRLWRFDLIAIDGDGLRHHKNAFQL